MNVDQSSAALSEMLRRVRADESFIGKGAFTPAAGEFAAIQLFNPAASGIVLVVRSIRLTSDVNDNPQLRWHNAGIGVVGDTMLTKNGLATGVAQAEQREASSAGLQGSRPFVQTRMLAETEVTLLAPGDDPLIIPAGEGVIVQSGSADANINANFQWHELGV